MNPDYGLLLAICGVLLCLDLALFAGVFLAKAVARRANRRRAGFAARLRAAIEAGEVSTLRVAWEKDPRATASFLRRFLDGIRPEPRTREALDAFLGSLDLVAATRRRLRSAFLHRRVEAMLELGLSSSPASRDALLGALRRERRRLGRLVALRQLALHPAAPDLAGLAAALEGVTSRRLRRELDALGALAPRLRASFADSPRPAGEAGLGLWLAALRTAPAEADWEALAEIASTRGDWAGAEAASILARAFPAERFLEAFGRRTEARFRAESARLLGATLAPAALPALDPWFADPDARGQGIAAATEVFRRHPGSEAEILDLLAAGPPERATCLARAIEHRLPSLLYHAEPPFAPGLLALVRALLEGRRTGIILEALGGSLPPETRKSFVELLRAELAGRPDAARFLSRHLPSADAAELGLPPPSPEPDRPQIPFSPRDRNFLVLMVLAGLALAPLVFLALHGPQLGWLSAPELLHAFIFDFHHLFAWYTIAINGIYFLLLLLSLAKILSQASLWELDLRRFLFSPGMLPSISILAPAYNEEATIVESVHSLLSLAYPSYEVIVVNDGSRDGTLAALVREFHLEPAGEGENGALASMPVRTIWRSPDIPNLTVIDKANGGKADALNAGLNRAWGEYVCSIDADSLLDPQALLRALFQVLARDREVIAIGGNIFPVNGCSVEHGQLQEIALPEAPLARFQTIEYLRSFIGGRLGWTALDGLIIISGAFGIFRRGSVLGIGGYLTGSGAHRQETVGEDMELVVRLVRADREAGGRGTVEYAYNATCWTEVPEDGVSLGKQRDRWHRGLMEVLAFHRDMAGKPRYGATGLLALPYFLLFELVGPWLESIGYVVLTLSLVLNLVDPLVTLTVFSIAILFGIAVSTASVLFAERHILYFRGRDLLRLLAVAFIENFGHRQATSMARVVANIQFFRGRKGWQKLARRGFSKAGGPS